MAHLYTYSCMYIILFKYICILNRFFPVNVTILFADVSSFLPMLLLKPFKFYKLIFFLELRSVNLLSCRLQQANIPQHFICYSIRERKLQKQKLSLISFHLYGMMITFWGLAKKTSNDYGVINVSKESMLLRLLIMYWEKRVGILKFIMFLCTKLI